MSLTELKEKIQQACAERLQNIILAHNELTLEVAPENLRTVCQTLRDVPELCFDLLIDLCGVDYLAYGVAEWETHEATGTGFERGVNKLGQRVLQWEKPRFAVVYHLLSINNNQRVRLRTFVQDQHLAVPSVIDIWNAANWFEREAFDLFGIIFEGHPDLRRILTDYGFTGHPFRKDFPVIGHIEPRYDATQQRIVYEPVSIEPRTLVPKVIRLDPYREEEQQGQTHG